MNIIKRFQKPLVPILLMLLFLSCKGKSDLDANGIPKELLIAIMPGEGPELSFKRTEPVARYLEKKLGVPVKLIKATDNTAVIEAIRSKKVHVAYLSSLPYVIASNKHKIIPLVALGAEGLPRTYKSLMITGKNSGIKNMEDVKKRSKSLTLAFSDPVSTSGHVIPKAYLRSIGLDPETNFKETLFSSSNAASILTVKAGKVDIGCTFSEALAREIRQGNVRKDEIEIIWTSEPVVSGPIVMRADINKAFGEKIRQAYLDLPKDAPKAWETFKKAYYPNDPSIVYVKAEDSMFNELRKLMAEMDDFKLEK